MEEIIDLLKENINKVQNDINCNTNEMCIYMPYYFLSLFSEYLVQEYLFGFDEGKKCKFFQGCEIYYNYENTIVVTMKDNCYLGYKGYSIKIP